jgi:hypothetical protein
LVCPLAEAHPLAAPPEFDPGDAHPLFPLVAGPELAVAHALPLPPLGALKSPPSDQPAPPEGEWFMTVSRAFRAVVAPLAVPLRAPFMPMAAFMSTID